jgi:ABC-type transporter Mla subunit MlaD
MDKQRWVEIRVGIFIFAGLAVIAAMVAEFGRIGQGFSKFYDITVTFDNAAGLIRNSDIQLAGARIGFVADTPRINETMTGVIVPLKIQEGVNISKFMRFQVGSSGLLGDKFVEITPSPEFDAAKFDSNDSTQILAPGAVVKGFEQGGFGALQKKGEEVLESLRSTSEELRTAISKLNNGVLVEENQKNLATTFDNLRKTSETFVTASKDIGKIVIDAQGAVETGKKALETTDEAAADLKEALADARKVMDGAEQVMNKMKTGPGLVPTLLNDKQISDNLRVFVNNLRERGVLFYKDSKAKQETAAPRR